MPAALLIARARFPAPDFVEAERCDLPISLVCSVVKAESDFRADAVSRAGAVGLMQLRPSTAEFICGLEGVPFEPTRLMEREYNLRVGCLYLRYLLGRFPDLRTALAAYNAGEGTVRAWLSDERYSSDGRTLDEIPFPETGSYVKKVEKFRKIYEILYR